MRTALLVVPMVIAALAPAATAQDGRRFVERAPLPRQPLAHSLERAGNPQAVKPHAVPSVTPRDAGGYVGGGRLLHNNLLARGPVAVGAVPDGTFGTDYAGLRVRPNRVFLAPSYDPSAGPAVARGYRTDGPHVPDIGTFRPLRNAVIEKGDAKGVGRGER